MRYFILIAVFSLCFTRFKNSKTLFRISMILYAVFLSLRYGQGVDYFSYNYSYTVYQPSLSEILFEGAWNTATNFEPGYNILVSIFKQLSFSYEAYIAILSIIMVILLYRFIIRYSQSYMLSFFVLYASYGIVIIESILRQGIAVVLLTTLAVPLLQDKKYIRAFIVMAIAYTFHVSSLLFIIVLLVFYNQKLYEFIIRHRVKIILLVAIPMMLLFNIVGIERLFNVLLLPETITSSMNSYFADSSGYSVTAMGYRAVMLIVVLFALRLCDTDKHTRKLLYLLATGYIVYFAVMQLSILSRMTMYFEFLEIVLIPAMVGGKWRYKFMTSASKNRLIGLGTVAYMAIISLLFYTEMNFTVSTSGYKTSYVPYISIFQKDEIEYYMDRENNLYLNELLEYEEKSLEKDLEN